jgi:hypothetical protein
MSRSSSNFATAVPGPTVIKATSSIRKPCLAGLSQTLALPVPRTADYSRLTALLTAQARLLTSSDIVWNQIYRAAAATVLGISYLGVGGLITRPVELVPRVRLPRISAEVARMLFPQLKLKSAAMIDTDSS